jgi:hypothetical protein
MTRKPLFLLATMGMLALASCLSDGSSGELNNGKFTYRCVDSSDATCDSFTATMAPPELIAVGAAFDLEYEGDTAESSPVQVEPASDKMMSGTSGSFKFLLPGVSAVLARNTSGVVSDFIHLRSASIDHLDVAGPSSTGAVTQVQMDTDDDVRLQAAPKGASGAQLAGALPYAWSTSDETIVSLSVPTAKNRSTLTGHKAGTATVQVTLPGGLKTSVVVTVKQGTNTSTGTGAGGAGSTGSTGGAGGAGGGK